MTAVLIGFALAALGVFVGRRTYRHGYTFPRLHDRSPEAKKSVLVVVGWSVLLGSAIIAWANLSVSPASASGLSLVLIMTAGVIASLSPFVGLVLGSKRGQQRLTRS